MSFREILSKRMIRATSETIESLALVPNISGARGVRYSREQIAFARIAQLKIVELNHLGENSRFVG